VKTDSPFQWAAAREEGHMKDDLKRIIDRLDEEDVYLLYVTALEMRRHG
jgi:hypothetical protein